MPAPSSSGSTPPRPPPKNAQTLPPTYLAHLSALLRQFLCQQLCKPDLSAGTTQRDREDRPIWEPGAVKRLHQTIWEGAMLHAVGQGGQAEGKAGLLGCDWDRWLEGAVKRRRACKERGATFLSPVSARTAQDEATRGRQIEQAQGSVATSANHTRESSVASKQRDGASLLDGQSLAPSKMEQAQNDLEEFCAMVREMPGFATYGEREGWDLVADTSPARTPIRDLPGAFPQMSSAWSPHTSTSRSHSRLSTPDDVASLPDQLLIVLCVQFAPGALPITTQSSASTMRTARVSSAEPSLSRASSILSPPQLHQSLSGMFSSATSSRHQHLAHDHVSEHGREAGAGSETLGSGGKSSGLGLNWWPSRWSEGTKGAKVEAEFVPGRFALPRTASRGCDAARGKATAHAVGVDEADDESDTDSSDEGSDWSGTQRAPVRDKPENMLLSAVDPDVSMASDDVGVVGGTFVIRGIQGQEERAALVRVLKGLIYALQCQLLELALRSSFGIPREPDAPSGSLRRAATRSTAPVTSPKIDTSIPAGTVKKHSTFFSKLGLENKGRNVLDGLMGRRRSIRPKVDIPMNVSGSRNGVRDDNDTGETPSAGRYSLDAHRMLSNSQPRSPGDSVATDTGIPHNPSSQARTLTHSESSTQSQTPIIALLRSESPSHPAAATGLHGIDRHLATLKRLEEMLHSTTPGLAFPLPRILLRVREEDKTRRDKAMEEIKAEQSSNASGIDGLPRDLAEDERKLEQAIKGRAAGYRLGGDVRVGLGTLASAIEGWEGWCRLQRLDVLTWDAVSELTAPEVGNGEEAAASGLQRIHEKGEAADDKDPPVGPAEIAPSRKGELAPAAVGEQEPEEKALPATPRKGTSARPASTTYIACTKPTLVVHRYHDRSSDVTIAAYMAELTEEMGGASSSSASSSSPPFRRTPPTFTAALRRPSSPTKPQPAISASPSTASGRTSPTKRESLSASVRRLSASTVSLDASSSNVNLAAASVDMEASTWENVCARSGCDVAARDHVRIWVQGSRRVVATFGPGEEGLEGLKVGVQVTRGEEKGVDGVLKGLASDMSFYKFLELILYTTHLVPPELYNAHLSADSQSPTSFTYAIRSSGLSVRFAVDDVPVLDARLPKLQVGPNVVKRRLGAGGAQTAFDGVLRKGWAETTQENVRSEVGAWVGGMRLRVHHLRREMTARDISQDAKDAALDALQGLLDDIDSTEKTILEELFSTSAAHLNNARLSFCAAQTRVQKALDDWMQGNKAEIPADFPAPCPVPEYAQPQGKELCIPGGSVLVRLDEPGSVIAYTLSSKAYFNELCSARNPRGGTSESVTPDENAPIGQLGGWTFDTKRKETPRDLLSLRTVTKKRSEASLPLRAPLSVTPNQPSLELNLEPVTGSGVNQSERMDEIVKTISKATAQDPIITTHSGSAPGSGTASVRSMSFGAEDGRISPSKRSISVSLAPSLTESEGDQSDATPTTSTSDMPFAPTPLRVRRRLTDDAPPSAFRRTVSASGAPMTPRTGSDFGALGTPPRSMTPSGERDKENMPQTGALRRTMLAKPAPAGDPTKPGKEREGWSSSVTSTFSNNFAHLLKFGTDVTDSLASRVRAPPSEASGGDTLRPGRGGDATPSSAKSRSLASAFMNPLSQFSTRGGAADRPNTPASHRDGADGGLSNALSLFYNRDTEDKPHIHFSFTLPGKTRIGCTVYYAAAFDTLRRRCAVDRSFVKSLEHTIGWAAEGGKSKANFWKSEDGRLVVKELVSKWNVSDMQALLEVAPAYFEHMANTHNRATSLAKIVGFFSVKVHDIQSGQKRTMDLLVMENLWWQQTVGKQYDLKGIEGRRVPKGREDASTLFDAEWLDAQAKDPILVHPAAKRILLESLAFDTRFLSQQSIMDYSLLLGLDDEKPEMVVGLVDAVGSYGLFKNIESRGKMAFSRGREGEVTVIPPDQYRERFETALKQYFTVAPDKWSRAVRRAQTDDLPLSHYERQIRNEKMW